MCFRPSEVSKPEPCPNCGKPVAALRGIKPKKCPYCHVELAAANKDSK